MNVIEYLTSEHENHHSLFEKVLSGETKVFEALRAALIRHVRLEEEFLFSPALRTPELEEATRLSWEEHNVLMDLLKSIDQKPPGSTPWLAKVRFLSKVHRAHTEEEETTFFPILAALTSEETLEELQRILQDARPKATPEEILYPETPGIHRID